MSKSPIKRMQEAELTSYTSRGGHDHPDNWAVCCRPCNQRKGMKTEAEFRKTMEAP